MKNRCPRCNLKFEREEGFFVGAYMVNLAVTEIGLGLILAVQILRSAGTGRSVALTPYIVVGVIENLLVPLLFYPFSKTLWLAIDYIARPLEPRESN